ncbi:MAG: UDP-2,4-diacetamido-2,4,6-trideoxy-beta-L-altropyranose hydrolase [Pseudomonadota bacterium]
MKVAVRTDASVQMGFGHLRRCVSLAQALRETGAEVRFLTRALGVGSEALLEEHGFHNPITLPAPISGFEPDPTISHSAWAEVSQQRDIDETITSLGGWAPDWLVVDHYALNANWHDAVRDAIGCRIAVIDDLADRDLSTDLLIDHNFHPDHRHKYAARLARPARGLYGPRYALLAPAFARSPSYAFSPQVRSIGIFMGGSDAPNFSELALEAVFAAGFDGDVEVVTTSANPHLDRLRARTANRQNVSLVCDLPDLSGFFSRHDLQIGAGGGATWERCCIGVPAILLVAAKNQVEVVTELASQKVVAEPEAPNVESLASLLKSMIEDSELRRELAANSAALVDGQGALRVALAMLASELKVRPVTQCDARALFDWRNAVENRRMMNNQEELVWANHIDWLDRVLRDKRRLLFIGEVGGQAVGSIRFDIGEDGVAEPSILLDPSFHGLGLGPYLLGAGEAMTGASTFHAVVLKRNRASQVLFERAGYAPTGPESWRKVL